MGRRLENACSICGVIDQSGLPLRIEQAWVRNLMRVFDALPSRISGWRTFRAEQSADAALWRPRGRDSRYTPIAAGCAGRGILDTAEVQLVHDYPTIAIKLRRAATPELASLIQDALLRRNELASYARREIYRELAAYCKPKSPFPR